MSAAYWPTEISSSFVNWHQLLCPSVVIYSLANCCCQLLNGQPISAAHCSTDISCSLSQWCQLLIVLVMSAAYCPSDVICSLAIWHQQLIIELISAAHWPNYWTNISCSLAKWCQLLIGQLRSAPHLSTDISCSLANWYQLLCPSVATCSLANCSCQLLNSQPISPVHWSVDSNCSFAYWYVSCSLRYWCHLIIGQQKSAAHCSIYISFLLAN